MQAHVPKFKLAVWKFASCDGCQLSLLDCEDEFLSLAQEISIEHFLEASSHIGKGPYDLSLVEGSISRSTDLKRIQDIRRKSKRLIAIGACATSGGLQALRNFASHADFVSHVYANPEYIDSLEHSLPISSYVKVDFELMGCPVDKHQLLELIAACRQNRKPMIARQSVCVECKSQGRVCVLVAKSLPCLGPVTQAGCGALCPTFSRACYSCFGPKENANTRSLTDWFAEKNNLSSKELKHMFRFIHSWEPTFRQESLRHEENSND
ncbi:MAG: oxidoreductase [Oligoflexus sp.]